MALIHIVDDDRAVREALRFVLEVEGFEVRLFESAAELLDASAPADDECLIVDHMMPRMTGIELVKTLRAQRCRVPAVLITTRADRELRRRASQAGVRHVLEKPLSGSALVECIRNALAGA